MASLKGAARSKHRRSMWWGAAAAGLATVATWFLAHEVLASLARYGEKLEAVVSLIAIGMLLLITNWFFHQVYWVDHMAGLHANKKRWLSGSAGQLLGLVILGFTSIYREGFETVLFLQALVLESGVSTVMIGVAIGLAATLLVGVLLFRMQVRLPYKKMLIVTGVMIGVVLLTMVGNTVHILQVVGWFPVHPIRWLQLPNWMELWFGVYASWEGISLQAAAAIFTIGSYFVAEYWQKRTQVPPVRRAASSTPARTKQMPNRRGAAMPGGNAMP
jgi:high-affinity iron transporter